MRKRRPLHIRVCVCCQGRYTCVNFSQARCCSSTRRSRLSRAGIRAEDAYRAEISRQRSEVLKHNNRVTRVKAIRQIPVVGNFVSKLVA
jgi:hypothetical protein